MRADRAIVQSCTSHCAEEPPCATRTFLSQEARLAGRASFITYFFICPSANERWIQDLQEINLIITAISRTGYNQMLAFFNRALATSIERWPRNSPAASVLVIVQKSAPKSRCWVQGFRIQKFSITRGTARWPRANFISYVQLSMKL